MISKFCKILFVSCISFNAYAQTETIDSGFRTTEELMAEYTNTKATPCATKIFADALKAHESEISESDEESVARSWAKVTMQSPEVLKQVLECPEIKSVSDETTVIFTPVVYTFPMGRTLTINYSTQPKVLKQHLILATKRSLPTDNPSPELMNPDDPAIYINTEPAWYAIMVVQHDSLSQFVGPDKNNTVSVKWIDENIKKIYPRGYSCTSKSAITLGNNYDTINKVVKNVVALDKDTNDYYVAGDVNLEWVMYAEIAADVIITVATWGGGAVASAAAKGGRATRTAKNLIKSVKELTKLEDVKKYMGIMRQIAQHSDDIAKLEKNIENAEKYEKALKNIEKARKAGQDATKYEKEAKEILEAAKKIDPKIAEDIAKMTPSQAKSLADIEKNIARYEKQLAELQGKNPSKAKELNAKIVDQKYAREKILNQVGKDIPTDIARLNPTKLREEQKSLQKSIKALEEDARKMEKASEDIASYKKQSDALADVMKLRREMRNLRRPQTGNIITRALRAIKGIGNSTKTLDKTARIARAGMSTRSAKINDWLFQTSLKHGSRLAKFESQAGFLYGVVSFLGDMYDQTSATSKEFSNGIDFKPLCLLFADDLEGQENVVNYGMWFMWVGNTTDPADDDAAYLQAMDFASKFYYELDKYQDKHGANCNVDIYVVRPIIRLDETNIDDPKGEMYYLFMNEIPWSTAEQFGRQVKNVEDWERTQQKLEDEDPRNKYKKPEQSAQQ
jgi:hypothetical protein